MDNNDKKNNRNGKKGVSAGSIIFVLVLAIIVTYFCVTFFQSCFRKYTTTEISYSEFLSMIENNEISQVEYNSTKITITPIKQPVSGITLKYYTGYIDDPTTFELLKSKPEIKLSVEIEDKGASIFDFILVYVLPFLMIYLVLGFVFKRVSGGSGGIMAAPGVAGQDQNVHSLTPYFFIIAHSYLQNQLMFYILCHLSNSFVFIFLF